MYMRTASTCNHAKRQQKRTLTDTKDKPWTCIGHHSPQTQTQTDPMLPDVLGICWSCKTPLTQTRQLQPLRSYYNNNTAYTITLDGRGTLLLLLLVCCCCSRQRLMVLRPPPLLLLLPALLLLLLAAVAVAAGGCCCQRRRYCCCWCRCSQCQVQRWQPQCERLCGAGLGPTARTAWPEQ